MRKWECWKCSDWFRESESKWGLVNEDTAFSCSKVWPALDSPLYFPADLLPPICNNGSLCFPVLFCGHTFSCL